ncbi:sulfite reductase flavoprotein subunit alpha [Nitrospirillum sp. BR 11828]|uniref:sulfite reductase flavoprotein subunit alpha n=1 Tax=Nitrospirillum sp. BR 11828 TaxID=3104325 RepID=UPI002ACA49CF|nr:sulfite reductase flavoprotein subunit alpha [Nitrospirillum sp. BR 11828]MDZ5650695.1 sulfite reductase flavoprotein subunit alpha [Nitrospirillum sp. BR 11828]
MTSVTRDQAGGDAGASQSSRAAIEVGRLFGGGANRAGGITGRWVVYQLHWLLGITLGFVLALMGITGATMSFEDQIMRALSPGVVTVAPRAAPVLTPDALLAQVRAQRPETRVEAVFLSARTDEAARVLFAGGMGGNRGERAYVDPYDGTVLGRATGEEFFAFVRRLHRWLALPGNGDGMGRQITGAAVMALLFFCASGLYLRWPRRPLDARAWLALDTGAKGRAFLWSLHAVIGTWVLLVYLVIGLTGLWWSYDWYRDGATRLLTGQPLPAREEGPRGEKGGGKRGGGGAMGGTGEVAPVSIDTAWAAFLAREGDRYATALVSVPGKPGAPVRVRYRPVGAPADQPFDEMALDGATGAVTSESHFADKALGARLLAGVLTLHRGTYFGTGGAVVFMAAAAAMPLFAITGLLMYLDRRRKKKAARVARTGMQVGALDGTAGPLAFAAADTTLTIAYASQTGTAEQLAWHTAGVLRDGGRTPQVLPLAKLDLTALRGRLLVVASTYGEGEPPDDARAFARKRMAAPADLAGVDFAVLALGDRQYETFCGFGRAVDRWLGESGATRLFAPVLVDDTDADALRQWQEQLRGIGASMAPDWTPEAYGRWRLAERRLLNPGSPGGPAYHLSLEPLDHPMPVWAAGDIAQILPGNDTGAHHRDYSIASLPAEGRVELLVRQQTRPDGTLGLGSGWLTAGAALGGEVRMRLRANPGFHAPAGPVPHSAPHSAPHPTPMILIGAGTGLAGLRGHLKHRRALGLGDAWLLFGERHAATDAWHAEEIAAWQADGTLARVDLVYSRDGQGYVQDRLAAQGDTVRAWVDRGAAIYVCGSLEGMAPGVDRALEAILGRDRLDALGAEGRYRRDVY